MAEGLTASLILTALCIGIIGFWIACRDLPYQIALFVSGIKILISVVYFAFFYNGTWNIVDDFTYFYQGNFLLNAGFNPITALTTSKGVTILIFLSEGQHFLYGWWNLLSIYLFGSHYYAPVFMNILLTFISGFFFDKILLNLDFSRQYRKIFLIFFLLHWDVLAWSSFINLKDNLVMTLTSIALYFIIKFIKKPRIHEFTGLVLVIYVFYWIRFYIPLLLLGAIGLWMLISWKNLKKYLVLSILLIIIYSYYSLLADHTKYLIFSSIFQNIIQFSLTPQPWSIGKAYTFLLFPSIFHWCFIIPAIISFFIIWRHYSKARIFLIYLLFIILFYAATPILQGPRERFQIVPILAWLQFHFVWILLSHLNKVINKQESVSVDCDTISP